MLISGNEMSIMNKNAGQKINRGTKFSPLKSWRCMNYEMPRLS